MTFTDVVLMVSIALSLLYAIYDEFLMGRRHGHTLLKVQLRRKHRLDALIFIVLVAILIYKNVTTQGAYLTTLLLFFAHTHGDISHHDSLPKITLQRSGFLLCQYLYSLSSY
ncbi:DUF986 family protein [Dickeya ananatis]